MLRIVGLFLFISCRLFHLTGAQPSQSPFLPYDCRFHMADVELPVEPIPQAELDALEIPNEVVVNVTEPPLDPEKQWKSWTTAGNFSFGMDRGNMRMITDLSSLHPYFRDKVYQLIQQCAKKGITLAVVEAYRTPAKQHEYKTMGKKYTRTGAGKSKHQYGLAADVVPIVDSVAQWNNLALWRKIGTIGEKLGLRWGGRWRNPFDPGHFEWTGGLTTVDLGNGKVPMVPNARLNYPCLEEDLELLRKFWAEWTTEQTIIARK